MQTPLHFLLVAPGLALLAPGGFAQASLPEAAPGSAPERPTTEGRVRMLRLRDGGILWAALDGHDPETLTVRRLETGGRLPLPWSLLDPAQEDALRLELGYVDPFADEVVVDAERLVLVDGTELVGAVVNRTEEHLWLKTASSTTPVAKRLVTSATRIQAPALDVYTRDELYQRRASELQDRLVASGRAGALAHLELARHCERLFDYARAEEHYRLVATLDAELESDAVRAGLERTRERASHQAQVDFLAEVDLLRARRRYGEAFERLEAFPRLFPDSPLTEDWNRLRGRVERYQERDLRERVVASWHRAASDLVRAAAREKDELAQALEYVESGLPEDIAARVREDLESLAPGISEGDVARLFSEREGGRFRQASYGHGTWILGEERALAGSPEDEPEAELEAGSQADVRRRLEARIERYLQNQELARQARSSIADFEDPEAFWRTWGSASRAQWLMARYIEDSGLFRDIRVRLTNCRQCGGTGTRELAYSGGGIAGSSAANRIVACPTCHTIGRVRRIRYR